MIMSIESAKAYIEKLKNDENFRKKALSCTNAEERMAFVKAEGFDFTGDEIKQLATKIDDSELEGLAGGGLLWDIYQKSKEVMDGVSNWYNSLPKSKCSSHGG